MWDMKHPTCVMLQVEQIMEELSRAWWKLREQPGGLDCIDMLVCFLCSNLYRWLSACAAQAAALA